MKPFPAPLPLKKLIGPSFIILALGLGSGEVILWPYLASNYGLGIAWGALLGITFQFFINMEIERYALVKGESVFVGIAKLWRGAPYWFIVSTFIGFGLPGIIAISAQVFSTLLGIQSFEWIAVVFLIIIGLILSCGKTVYGLMEKLTRTILLIGVPFVFLLALTLSSKTDWTALAAGMIGMGDGYRFFPDGIVLATFFAAFAYSGAGGNLNLTQSIYIKEKGYGMGKYAQRISGLFQHKKAAQQIHLEGVDFTETEQSRKNFSLWWRQINIEHGLIFWFIGALSIMLLMLLSYTTTYHTYENGQGIQFILNEATMIGSRLFPAVGSAFLLIVSVMLFQTQLGVLDSTSRIMSENAALAYMKRKGTTTVPLSKIYFWFVWAQILFGSVLILLHVSEPKTLLILGACLNAVAMFVHVGLVSVLNHLALPKFFRPELWRKLILAIIFLFFGCFSAYIVMNKLF